MMTLPALWDASERATPGKAALVADGERLTYAEVGERIRRLSGALAAEWGIGRGSVVALLAPNCTEFVIAYFAIVRLGAIVQPVDERLRADEMASHLRDSGARVAIVHRALWERIATVRHELPELRALLGIGVTAPGVDSFAAWIAAGVPLPGAAVAPDHVAELMYTSGTTGGAKAVMRSHANVRAASRNSWIGFGYETDDVIAIVMPLSHSSALNSQMMPVLELGGTLVLVDRFDAPTLLELVRSECVTCLRAVPTMLRLLLGQSSFTGAALPSLRLLLNSSAAIDPQTYIEVKRRFPVVRVMNSYGLTEASTCTILPDEMALTRPDSIGRPIDGVEMRVVDDRGAPLADEEDGELCVRGPHVFVGYRNLPPSARQVDADGWMRTGDLGHRDAEGFYYLIGRRDDVINCGGYKVVPLEVENCILEMVGIAEVAVAAAPHRLLGSVVKAFVVPREGAVVDGRDVRRHCLRRLASHKVPFHVEVVPSLPKNSVGKVVRRRLRELELAAAH